MLINYYVSANTFINPKFENMSKEWLKPTVMANSNTAKPKVWKHESFNIKIVGDQAGFSFIPNFRFTRKSILFDVNGLQDFPFQSILFSQGCLFFASLWPGDRQVSEISRMGKLSFCNLPCFWQHSQFSGPLFYPVVLMWFFAGPRVSFCQHLSF